MDAVKKSNAAVVPDLPDGRAACCNAGVPAAALLMIFLACILVGTVHCWKSSTTTPNTHAGRRLKKMNSKQATMATNALAAVPPVCWLFDL